MSRFATIVPVLALAMVMGMGSAVHAQTNGGTNSGTGAGINASTSATTPFNTTTNTTTAPGAPNTGAGGEAGLNFSILAVTGLAAITGAAYLARAQTRF